MARSLIAYMWPAYIPQAVDLSSQMELHLTALHRVFVQLLTLSSAGGEGGQFLRASIPAANMQVISALYYDLPAPPSGEGVVGEVDAQRLVSVLKDPDVSPRMIYTRVMVEKC